MKTYLENVINQLYSLPLLLGQLKFAQAICSNSGEVVNKFAMSNDEAQHVVGGIPTCANIAQNHEDLLAASHKKGLPSWKESGRGVDDLEWEGTNLWTMVSIPTKSERQCDITKTSKQNTRHEDK